MITVSTIWKAPSGRTLTEWTELTISGEKGRFRFLRHVDNGKAQWVDVVGGKPGHELLRSFKPERVEVVHRLRKMR